MCLILDVNVVHKVFPAPHDDFKPIHKALISGRARLVYGGELTREYERLAFRRVLLRLDQRGAAKQFPDSAVDAEAERLRRGRLCKSNDTHILALAEVSGARLLCSEDVDLGDDFTNAAILSKPRGSVYKRVEHEHLIREHCG